MLIIIASVFVYVTLGFVFAVLTSRNDIADVMWGPGVALCGWVAYVQHQGVFLLLLNILVSVWAVRLAYHIGTRFFNKSQEDARYAQWRKEWKYFYLRSYAQVFLLQGCLMILVALPAIAIMTTHYIPLLVLLGGCVWIVGFVFEALGDYQLKEFLQNKKDGKVQGEIMQSGLWKYTRHPNYFGEVTLWWGLWIMTLGTGLWYGIIGPITITILILYVSGIPMTEARYKGNAEFEEYKRRTNAFFPWFPTQTQGKSQS
jgi:steroid 5-alpha reductase family enzyme